MKKYEIPSVLVCTMSINITTYDEIIELKRFLSSFLFSKIYFDYIQKKIQQEMSSHSLQLPGWGMTCVPL